MLSLKCEYRYILLPELDAAVGPTLGCMVAGLVILAWLCGNGVVVKGIKVAGLVRMARVVGLVLGVLVTGLVTVVLGVLMVG